MDKKIQESRDYWDAMAPKFDKFEVIMRQAWSVLVDNSYLQVADSVLEIGCGRGACSSKIASLLKPGAKFTITDLSPNMIQFATQNVTLSENITIETANALELKFKDKSFDRYIANMTLHLVPDPDQMLRESRRVLKDDGYACFSVWGAPSKSLFFSLHEDFERNFTIGKDLELLKRRCNDAGFSRVSLWSVDCVYELWDAGRVVDFWKHEEIREKVQDAINQGIPIGLEAVVIFCRP